MNYPEEFINEIKARNDIVEIISEVVALQRKGKYLVGDCPFHKGKSKSFCVTPDEQIFHCFACRKGGNVINFIMAIKNLNFKEAVEYLMENVGLNPDEIKNKDQELNKHKDKVIEINKVAGRFFLFTACKS